MHEVLEELHLTSVKDSLIGDKLHRGVSGGERKRVSIGKELCYQPKLLLLDEPTSGALARCIRVVPSLREAMCGARCTSAGRLVGRSMARSASAASAWPIDPTTKHTQAWTASPA